MKIYFTDQQQYLTQRLEELKAAKVMSYDPLLLKEKITEISLNTPLSLHELNLGFFFDYQLFPSNTLCYKTQWHLENRSMKMGDTIAQHVFLPPTRFGSLKLIFGVRINSIIDEPTRRGFSYETLEGHVEKGISTFTIEETDAGLVFKIHTYSVPGNWLSRLAAPFFSIPYQRFCTKKALENVKQQVES